MIAADELKTMRDALLRARATGTRSVEYDGHKITYATDSEMAAALADLERRIAIASRTPSRAVRLIPSKGV
ncbi:phage head-tail joining protein [Celeribacter halophilus]|uniref:GpW protein n=1 Tax=Celeribacter halophilus TaxID=576117 RepID=A0A1I3NPP5_9RHOB|nr:hypothetical protein [Celeribacter halophilus]PZX14596.1 hypothetical protein LX82_00384 [Celeribacter halophilus]SFJ11288.1 hypothetical protein SAMN04488138_10233 [Celeribacter halophilus]